MFIFQKYEDFKKNTILVKDFGHVFCQVKSFHFFKKKERKNITKNKLASVEALGDLP